MGVLGLTTAQLAATAVAAPVGAMLHELTHAATARLLGAETDTSLLDLRVDFSFPVGTPTWKHRLVLLSPGVTGVVCACAAFLSGVSLGGWWLPVALGWLFYTVSFRLEDYSLRAARGEWQPLSTPKDKAALRALAITLVGVVALVSYRQVPNQWAALLWIVGYSSLLGGPAGMFLEFHRLTESESETTRAGA